MVGGVGSLQALAHVALDQVLQRGHQDRKLPEAQAAPGCAPLDELQQVLRHVAAQLLALRGRLLRLARRVETADVPRPAPEEALVQGVARGRGCQESGLVLWQRTEQAFKLRLQLRDVGGVEACVRASQRRLDLLEERPLEALRAVEVELPRLLAALRRLLRKRSHCADTGSETLQTASRLFILLFSLCRPPRLRRHVPDGHFRLSKRGGILELHSRLRVWLRLLGSLPHQVDACDVLHEVQGMVVAIV
mmetsp:Transcript_29326/g.87216  ORF Transcript_29326/g.87216 Transcript_29326/m.87216 type:complete len:249 (+) Transcript_29326:561-1307(+)